MRKHKVHYLDQISDTTLCGRKIMKRASLITFSVSTTTCKTCLKILERNKCNPVSLKSELSVKDEKETLPELKSDRSISADSGASFSSGSMSPSSPDWCFWGMILIVVAAILALIIWG